jgi:hypothetical protein
MVDWSAAILIWLICGVAAYAIAKDRGATNQLTWFLVGVVFGPLGVIAAFTIQRKGPEPGQYAQPVIGVADELTKLAALRDAGAITEDEFQRQRSILLPPVAPAWGPSTQAPPNSRCGNCGKPLSPVWRGRCEHCKAAYSEHHPIAPGIGSS